MALAESNVEPFCVIHYKDSCEKIKSCTSSSYSKIIECAKEWIKLDGRLQHVANNLDLDSTLQAGFGYHPTCYVYFTSLRNINQAKARVTKCKARLYSQLTSTNIDNELRSRNTIPSCSTLQSDSENIPPQNCIICQKIKRRLECHSGKKVTEKLVSSESNARSILKSARLKVNEQNNDQTAQRILVRLGNNGKACSEVKYHRSCFTKFTKCLYTREGQTPYYLNESFNEFCKTVIEKQIIENGEVFRLIKLKDLFIQLVSEKGGIAIENYRTFCLKRKLQSRYPNLTFVRQAVNTSELVLYNNLDASVCIELDEIDTNDESDVEIVDDCKAFVDDQTEVKDLFNASQSLKCHISNCPSIVSWPPTSEDINFKKVCDIVPPKLFNFIAWTTNKSDTISTTEYVSVSDDAKVKIFSICQDIISLASNGRKLMPKNVSLSMAIRHISGSSKLIDIISGLGHCMSHSFTLEHDTALAHQQLLLQESVPHGMKEGHFTTLVWDNNDFGEETLSGKGTTHNTNGIIIQRTGSNSADSPALPQLPRTKRRRLDETTSIVEEYFPKRREGPNPDQTTTCPISKIAYCNPSATKDFILGDTTDTALYFAKCIQDGEPLPGWTGCNVLSTTVPPHEAHRIGYLPVIDASPTQLSTVYTVLKRSLLVAATLLLNSIVIVVDQALYAKIQDIRWQEKGDFINKIVVRLGEFHTSMSFLGIIGKRFGEAGLKDILVESGVIAEGSVPSVLNGHKYNRSTRCHKLICDALMRLQIEQFINSLDPAEKENAMSVMTALKNNFPNGFLDNIQLDGFQNLLKSFNIHVKKMTEENITYKFWNSYIEITRLLLQFLRGTREGNWKLHLVCIRLMMPWFFSYGRINYSRYLPVYLKEMSELHEVHPDVYDQFLLGDFAVQRCAGQPFTMTACDQTIEQTINRDSKTRGGMKGLSLDPQAVNRWVLSHASRAGLTNALLQMVGENDEHSWKSELTANRIKSDEEDVLSIMRTIQTFENPFTSQSSETLINLASGVEADLETTNSIMTANIIGETAFQEFYTKRLVTGESSLFDPIKIPKLKSFSNITNKSSKTNVSKSTKEDKELYIRLILVAQNKKIDLQNLLTYPLATVPTALGHSDGSLRRTNKSILIKCLENVAPSCLEDLTCLNKVSTTLIIDGMAIIRQQKPSETICEFSSSILKRIIALAQRVDANRIDFIIDLYQDKSIKAIERKRRSQSTNVVRLLRKDQKMPSSLSDFLGVNKNKEALLNLLWEEWQSDWGKTNIDLYMCHGSECDKVYISDGQTQRVNIPQLCCDHEEADTRIFLHALHAAKTNTQRIIIYSPDSDVIVIGISLSFTLGVDELYSLISAFPITKLVNLKAISNVLHESRSKALIGLHAFSGCDSVSSFLGKGKQKMFSFMMNSLSWQLFFSSIGSSWAITSNLEDHCEKLTCELYGWGELCKINDARFNCFRLTVSDSRIPPNRDSLLLHLKRANYQARIWRLSMEQKIDPPAPENHGWCVDSETLSILWSTLPVAPSDLMDITSCSCKKSSCKKSNCSCIKNNLKCNSICRCINCKNTEVDEDNTDV